MNKTPSMQELLEAGVHFGHQTRRGNPRMGQYIYGVRDGVHIINLEQTEQLLKEACEFVYQLGEQGKTLLFVGTKKQAQDLVVEAIKDSNAPYLNYRWMGGTLTNFDELRKNIKKLLDLDDKKAKGELGHYTKKEQLLISRKIEKFRAELGGIATMDRLPDALFIIDVVNEKTALNEARKMSIPVVAVTDTNSDPDQVDYPIPANDDATKSIKIVLDAIADAYKQGLAVGLKNAAKKAAQAAADAEKDALVETATEPSEEVAALEQEVEKKEVRAAERVV